MDSNRRKQVCLLILAVFLTMIFILAGAEEIRYGFTLTKIRVRSDPSTKSEIIDHILEDRCVLINAEITVGGTQFIGVTYRDAEGGLSTGWIARSDGGKKYVDDLSNEVYTSEFALALGTLPEEVAGTSGHHSVDLSWAQSAQRVQAPAAQSAPSETAAATQGQATRSDETSASSESDTELVRYCQQALKDLGIYYGEITGNIGTKTKNSIKVFQRQAGLTATGELDATTVSRIREAVEPESAMQSASAEEPVWQETETVSVPETATAPTYMETNNPSVSDTNTGNLTIDSTGETVYQIQERLQEMGYYSGSLTGHFGSKTAAAVKRFQKEKGLPQTGIADPDTVSAILYGISYQSTETPASYQETSTGNEKTETPINSGTVFRKGDQSDVIAEMQTLLASLKIYSGDITGHFGSKTKDAVQTFQRKNGITVSGDLDEETMNAIRTKAAGSTSTPGISSDEDWEQEPSYSSGGSGSVYTLDWFTAKNNGVFPYLGLVRGNYATLKDLNSGKSLRVYIQSAGYHLDVEPATASDTSTFCSVYGVSSSSSIPYNRRPALLTTSEGYKIVCSIYGTPHGQQVITNNNYSGQFCLHFLNSKTSGSGKVDSDHQKSIQSAISMTGGSAKTIKTTSDIR